MINMNNRDRRIAELLFEHEQKERSAFSKKYPFSQRPIIFLRRLQRTLINISKNTFHCNKQDKNFKYIIARHQSVLRRKLGGSDPRLQEQKIVNLQQAVKRLDGIIIEPGQVFSFWKNVGKPKYKKGYVDGMLLSNGRVVEGIGGGLCQLSNFLYWIFLHAPTITIERHHHSKDVFPDSGRTLPFGSGATVFYNYIDLQIENISPCPLQMKVWLTGTHLKGQILSDCAVCEKIHIFEKDHCFVKRGKAYFRYNVLYRQIKVDGKVKDEKKIVENFAPVLYKVTSEYLKMNQYKLVDFTKIDLQEYLKSR